MPIIKTDFEQLMNQARVKLVGASDGGLKGELYDVLSEFFNDSSIWTQCVMIVAQPNVFSYPVSVNEGQIIRLNGVMNFGPTQPVAGAVPPSSPTFMPAIMPQYGLINLKNSVQTTNYLGVDLVTNVALPTTRDQIPLIPDWVIPVWHVGILDGLLGKMMAQPQKSYSNDKQSQYHLRRFRDAIGRARVSKLRANTIGTSAWRFPQTFRSLSQQGGVPAVGSANERSF